MAERYLNDIQSSPTKIDNYNQSFKKFNLALQAAKQGNDDLALIHLKKVVNLNLHFIKAMHLMALIYIKQEQYAKANKILQRAKRIDVSNNTTLRYLEEVKSNMEEEEEKSSRLKKENLYNTLAPVDIGIEAKSNWSAFIYLVVGIVIGIAVVATLVVPSISLTIALSSFNSKFKSDDLPVLGFPIITVFTPSLNILPLSKLFSKCSNSSFTDFNFLSTLFCVTFSISYSG